MAEELISRQAAINALCDNCNSVQAMVEVVRCKDCKWYSEDGWGYGNCERKSVDYLRMSANDFCSKGERKDESTMSQLKDK